MKNLPIVIAPGFFTSLWPNGLSFKKLEDEGFKVVSPPPNFLSICNIHTQTFYLSNLIDKTLKKYNVSKVNLVGVSLGGIVGLYYIHNFDGAKKISTFISICSPFYGTWAALPGALTFGPIFGSGAWEILPISQVLRELREKKLPEGFTRFYAFAGRSDKMVPHHSASHPRAYRTISLPGGHSDLCLARNDRLLYFLQNIFIYERGD